MAKTVPLDRLGAAIAEILGDYQEEVTENVIDAVEAVTKAGARAVSQSARSAVGGSGRYARGWKATVEKTRFGAEGNVHNASVPGLPHLLEHGHAKRGGGRVSGRTHIKPVEDRIVKDFERKVKQGV